MKSIAPKSLGSDASSHSASGVRPKHLGLHEFNLPTPEKATTAPALDSSGNEDPRDSGRHVAALLLRRSRDELELSQDCTAALIERHPTIIGRREREEVHLGPLSDWCLMIVQMIRENGAEKTAAFMAEFIQVLNERDLKK